MYYWHAATIYIFICVNKIQAGKWHNDENGLSAAQLHFTMMAVVIFLLGWPLLFT